MQGLAYLNEAPRHIIHYDLKPANILFDSYGQAKITVRPLSLGPSKDQFASSLTHPCILAEGHVEGIAFQLCEPCCCSGARLGLYQSQRRIAVTCTTGTAATIEIPLVEPQESVKRCVPGRLMPAPRCRTLG